MKSNVQTIERQQLPAKNNICSKVILSIAGRNKDFPRHTEAEGMYHKA